MAVIDADIAIDAECRLGEGPVWTSEALWFVDIEGRHIHRYTPRDGDHRRFEVPRRPGFAIPSAQHGWVIGQDASIATWHPDQPTPILRHCAAPSEHNLRFNDAKCDPTGRLYAGTMHLKAEPRAGALFTVNGDFQMSHVIDNVTISNGLAWDTATSSMYYIDTASGQIDRFDWHADTGSLRGRTPIAAITGGVPDGMCIDAEGFLWVAIWGGSRVARIDPASGREVGAVRLPCPNVTSCCFGGERLDQLWITSATIGLNDEALAAHLHAGGVFVAEPGVEGHATTPMA
jgi:sugar lactone lactonase YvrE